MADESIYDLIPEPERVVKKAPRYKSKFAGDVAPSYSTFGGGKSRLPVSNVGGAKKSIKANRSAGATFGTSGKHVPDFKAYSRKKKTGLPEPKKFTYDNRRKPALNTKLDKKAIPKREKKNFVTKNAVENILKGTKKPVKKEVRYAKKPDFGKVPEYLNEVKADIQKEKEFIEHMLEKSKENEESTKGRIMDEQEREELLVALKLKWEDVNEQYQKIAHIVKLDTIGKLRRKEQYEKELDELDQAIQKLSKGTVYVTE